jgi:Tol biopolymer transport system component
MDGRYIWVDESDNIVQTNADGSNQQGLLDSGTFYQEFPDYVTLEKRLVMSENNSHVFFIACQPGMGEAATCHFFQLNLSTGAVSRVAAFSNNDPYPTWINPDGERAVYAWDLACKGSLYISNERIPLSGTPISLVWLPDKRFVFSRHICKGQWDAQEVEPQYDIILAKADGSDAQALVAGMIASDMALSPDQQTLAFITTDPSPVALWLVNLDGSGLRQVMDLPSDALDILWR